MIDPEQLHEWYLEATQKLNPESYNEDAQKPFDKLTQEQKYIDCYIASKVNRKIREQIKKRISLAFDFSADYILDD